MADMYVWDGGNDSDGSDWTNAYQTLADGLANVGAGEIVYVASEHTEQLAGNTNYVSTSGTAADPVTIISVDKDNSDAYLAMRDDGSPGSIDGKTGGAYDIKFSGFDIYVGLTFKIGDDFGLNYSATGSSVIFEDCEIYVDDYFQCGNSGNATLNNCLVKQVTIGNFDVNEGGLLVKNTTYSFDGGSCTYFLKINNGIAIFEDCDLSGLAVDDYLVYHHLPDQPTYVLFKRCKLPEWDGGGLMNNLPKSENQVVKFHSCSSSNIIYQFSEYYFAGEVHDETTIYRNSAATYDGTNEYSVKMVSNTNSVEWARPLRFKLAEVWCSANPTLTVELIQDDGTTVNDDQFWIEIEYPDSTIGALGKLDQTSRPATKTTAASELTTSSLGASDWSNEGGSANFYKVAVTISGGQAGIHTVWACQAKASGALTTYVCPQVDVT